LIIDRLAAITRRAARARARPLTSLSQFRDHVPITDFDFKGFRDAFLNRDAERWLAYYSPHVEWWEYRHNDPPSAPNVMRGLGEVGAFLHGVAASPIAMEIENEVVDDSGAAFTLTVSFDDGRRIVENVIVTHREGKVTRQIDVEAWDH